VLLAKRPGCDEALAGIAGGVSALGAMLPYTPIQWLLYFAASGAQAGTAWMQEPQDLILVMTSANPSGEPLVTGNEEAMRRLAGIADAFVVHDRDIAARCDDSLVRATHEGPPSCAAPAGTRRAPSACRARRHRCSPPAPGSRARCASRAGPKPSSRPTSATSTTAPPARRSTRRWRTCSRSSRSRPRRVPTTCIPISIPATSPRASRPSAAFRVRDPAPPRPHRGGVRGARARGPVLGLALDGVGMGTDGTAWGGELLRVDGARFSRLGTWASCGCPAAIAPRASPGAWRHPSCTRWGAAPRSPRASSGPARRSSWRCSSAAPTRLRRPPPAAGSMPPPHSWACAR